MKSRPFIALAVIGLLVASGPGKALAHEAHKESPAPTLTGASLFEPPPPGTYELPPICQVKEHWLLGPDGKRAPLLGLGKEEAAIVSFVYRTCVDATGCPLALATLQRLDAELASRPGLAKRVRLVTVSFDPKRDTPERMKELRGHLAPQAQWRFLTAANSQQLVPVLSDFNQNAVPLVTEEGEETGLIRHVLKVYLVDGRGDVRNIYSTGFLDQRILLNDLQTVLAEE